MAKLIKELSELDKHQATGTIIVVGLYERNDEKHKLHLSRLSKAFRKTKFLQVDFEPDGTIEKRYSIKTVPMIIIFEGAIEKVRCAEENIKAVKQKLALLNKTKDRDPDRRDLVPAMLDREKCFCLNERDDHPLSNCFDISETVLKSDLDHKLIIGLEFSQLVKLEGIAIKCPAGAGVKNVRFFVNRPPSFDFDEERNSDPIEEISFNERQTTNREVVAFQEMDFKIVQNLIISVETNQRNAENTVIQQLTVLGSPFKLANLANEDFKRPTAKTRAKSRSTERCDSSSSLSAASLWKVEQSLQIPIKNLLLDKEPDVAQLLAPLTLQTAPNELLEKVREAMTDAFGLFDFPTGLIPETAKSNIVIYLLGAIIKFVQLEKSPSAIGFFKVHDQIGFKIQLDGETKPCKADLAIVMDRTDQYSVILECKKSNCDDGVKQTIAFMVKAFEANEENGCRDVLYGFCTTASDFIMLRYDGQDFRLSEQFRFLFSRMLKDDFYKDLWSREFTLIVHILYTILKAKIDPVQFE